MLHRQSKPKVLNWIRKGAAVLFVAEAAAFGVSYLLWARLNTDRDFRQYMSDKFPSILNGYYKIGETLSGIGPSNSIRSIDAEYWRRDSTANGDAVDK